MPNIIANTVGYEDFCKENEYYKRIIEDNDLATFKESINAELPRTDAVFEEAFVHDIAWADARIEAGYSIKKHSNLLFNAVRILMQLLLNIYWLTAQILMKLYRMGILLCHRFVEWAKKEMNGMG